MPQTRMKKFKRTTFKKSRKRLTKKEMVEDVIKLKKQVSEIYTFSEAKSAIHAIPMTNITFATPMVITLNTLSQGVTETTRLGDEVRAVRLLCNYKVFTTQNAMDNTTVQQRSMRVMIVREKPALGQILTLTSLFLTSPPQTYSIFNYIDRDIKNRFYILHDKTYVVDGQNFEYNTSLSLTLRFKVSYARGFLGTIADIDTNSLAFIVITDHVDVLEQYVVGSTQFFFKDS